MKRRRIIGVLLIAAAVICAVIALREYLSGRHANEEYESLREAVASDTESASSAESAASETSQESAEEVPIDFTELRKSCPDAYAWIYIDGTNVDYPVVQAKGDQSYYLTHSAEQETSRSGAIYTEDLNKKDFSDPVTVIYGHNMRDGSMFQSLHRYEDRAFFNEHREIIVYLPQKVLHYRVFSAYNTDDRHILKTYDFSNTDDYQSYLDYVMAQKSMTAYVADDADVTVNSHILVLSTCNGIDDQRYIVQAVLETD